MALMLWLDGMMMMMMMGSNTSQNTPPEHRGPLLEGEREALHSELITSVTQHSQRRDY
jgi:hypothetical protein